EHERGGGAVPERVDDKPGLEDVDSAREPALDDAPAASDCNHGYILAHSRRSAYARRVLFTPARHEPLHDRTFSESAARDAIGRIVERAAGELDRDDGRWPLDVADADAEGDGPGSGLYFGAAGIAWALGELEADGYAAGEVVDRAFVERLEER